MRTLLAQSQQPYALKRSAWLNICTLIALMDDNCLYTNSEQYFYNEKTMLCISTRCELAIVEYKPKVPTEMRLEGLSPSNKSKDTEYA